MSDLVDELFEKIERLKEESARAHNLMNINLRALEIINSGLNLKDTLSYILESTSEIIDFPHGGIFMPNEDDELEVIVSKGYDEDIKKLKYKEGLVYYSFKTQEEIYVPDQQSTDWGEMKYRPAFMNIGLHKDIKSICISPFSDGAIEIFSHNKDAFDDNTRKSLKILANIIGLTVQNVKLRDMEQKQYEDIIKLKERERNHIIELTSSIYLALERTDPFEAEHSPRVAKISEGIALEMGLDKAYIEKLKLASLMHDIGKCMIDDYQNIRSKPFLRGRNPIRQPHVLKGLEILDKFGLITQKEILNAIKYHHEWYDGDKRGYLGNLKGDAIPLEARIIAIADVYEALTAVRPYRKGKKSFTRAEAIEHIIRRAGTHFDPKVVKAFTRYIKKESKKDLISSLEELEIYKKDMENSEIIDRLFAPYT